MLTHFSLCTGIGGLDLAAELAGFSTLAQCEIDDYASKVLKKNFPRVPNLNDIRTVTLQQLTEHGIDGMSITVISAGFPCQPYSLAGKGLGDSDVRDLWSEVARVVGEIKPRWFVGENTPGLFARSNQRFFRRVLADLAALGYSVGWGIWGACDVGAPHKRNRIFILAHSDGKRRRIFEQEQQKFIGKMDYTETKTSFGASCLFRNFPYTNSNGRRENKTIEQRTCKPLIEARRENQLGRTYSSFSYADCFREQQSKRYKQESRERACDDSWWQTEPDVGRVANGVPSRVDRLRCLGNAVVPQQAYPIFKAIADYELSDNDNEED